MFSRFLAVVAILAVCGLAEEDMVKPGVPQKASTVHRLTKEPARPNPPGQPKWAGRWQTDMGNLNLVHMGREVYGRLEGNTKGDFSGVTTTDPRIVIGQVRMTAFTVSAQPCTRATQKHFRALDVFQPADEWYLAGRLQDSHERRQGQGLLWRVVEDGFQEPPPVEREARSSAERDVTGPW